MKWLIYALVVVNVGVFVWQYRRADMPMSVPAIADAGSHPRLLLRHEASDSSLLPRGALADGDVPPAGRRPADEGPGSAGPSRQSTGQSVGPRADFEAAQTTGEAAARQAAVSSDRETAYAAKGPRTCVSMGPFSAEQPVEALLIWLQGKGGEAASRWTEQETVSRYWVYLPPLETVEQARVVLRRLKDDGLQDYIRVMRGPMRNAISLGLFKQRDSADRRLAELRGKGYAPKLDIRYKKERVRWLDVAFSRKAGFPEATFRTEFPSVTWSPAHCPVAGPIAGTPAIP